MSTKTTSEMLAAQIDAQLSGIEEASEARDNGAEEYDGVDPQEWLDDNALEVSLSYHVDIVLCTGGPDVRLECEVSKSRFGGFELDRMEVVGRWGSEVIRRYVSDGPVWDYAVTIVEAMEDGEA